MSDYAKQTQTNPILSAIALAKVDSNPSFKGLTQMIEIGLGEFLGITSKFALGILIWLIVAGRCLLALKVAESLEFLQTLTAITL